MVVRNELESLKEERPEGERSRSKGQEGLNQRWDVSLLGKILPLDPECIEK